jgi:hypothetical protein
MPTPENLNLIQSCADESLKLLHRNLTAKGVLAASRSLKSESRHYTRIFGRDAAICGLGMIISGDAVLIEGVKQSLLTLARHQADNGQIPKYVDPEEKEADFWYLGCIDATLWWLITVKVISRLLPDTEFETSLAQNIAKALTWLHCQEHPRLFLLQQNEASDWADIMPRSGFVLYTNALWFYVKRLYGLPYLEETKYHFNHLFYPFTNHIPEYRRLRLLTHFVRNKIKNRDLYLSFVNFSFWGEEGDVFANLLAILFGLADDERTNQIVKHIERIQKNAAFPVRVVGEPISKDNPLWRAYMGRHRQNLAHQYHNGGIWPFVGGFWVMVLSVIGKAKKAQQELEKLASANHVNGWEFNEWFHGQSNEPKGMAGQSWNAAMFLLAKHTLQTGKFF